MKAGGSLETLARPMCVQCGRTFNHYKFLGRHCQVKHGFAAEMHCSLCGVNLPSCRDYKAHALSAHNQTILHSQDMKAVCGLCGCSTGVCVLWWHIRTVHLHLSYLSTECLVCAKVVGKKDLQTHYTEEHPSMPCHRCTQVFGSVMAYCKHFSLIHMNPEKAAKKESIKAIMCGLCNELFELPKSLIVHIFSIHLQLVPKNSTVCLYCCLVLPFTDLIAHLNSLHLTFQCLLCGRNFIRVAYSRHLNSHFAS